MDVFTERLQKTRLELLERYKYYVTWGHFKLAKGTWKAIKRIERELGRRRRRERKEHERNLRHDRFNQERTGHE